jgi:RimJ/RimL family protein N-acetyltransferase
MPDFRNKGFGKLTASACIEECINNKLTPYWHCNVSNKPSVSVAENIGFKVEREYQVFSFQL